MAASCATTRVRSASDAPTRASVARSPGCGHAIGTVRATGFGRSATGGSAVVSLGGSFGTAANGTVGGTASLEVGRATAASACGATDCVSSSARARSIRSSRSASGDGSVVSWDAASTLCETVSGVTSAVVAVAFDGAVGFGAVRRGTGASVSGSADAVTSTSRRGRLPGGSTSTTCRVRSTTASPPSAARTRRNASCVVGARNTRMRASSKGDTAGTGKRVGEQVEQIKDDGYAAAAGSRPSASISGRTWP